MHIQLTMSARARLFPRIVTALAVGVLAFSTADAQLACDLTTVEQASVAYRLGRFDQTFGLLNPCVPGGFPERAERVDAYRLLALSYIATDSLEHARALVKRLVELDPRHRTDPQIDPPLFVQYVQEFRPKWYTWLWKGGAWYRWAGRGLVVAGLVTLPIVLRSHPEADLPAPPPFPPN